MLFLTFFRENVSLSARILGYEVDKIFLENSLTLLSAAFFFFFLVKAKIRWTATLVPVTPTVSIAEKMWIYGLIMSSFSLTSVVGCIGFSGNLFN